MAQKVPRVSTRINPCRTAQACAQAEHDTRTRPPSYLKTEADAVTYLWEFDKELKIKGDPGKLREKNANNDDHRDIVRKILKQSAQSQRERYQETVKRKPQSNANWFIRGIITFSPEGVPGADAAADEKDKFNEELQARARHYIETLATDLNVNPIYMSIHKDETTVHIHFQLESTDKDTGKSVSRWIRRNKCKQMQDMVAAEFAPMGFERGISREITGAKHKSVRESHRIEQQKLEAKTKEKVKELEGVTDEIGYMELQKEALEQEKRDAEAGWKEARKKKRKAEQESLRAKQDTESLRTERSKEAQELIEIKKEQSRLTQENSKLTKEVGRMAGLAELGKWAEAEMEIEIDKDVPGYDEFERFVRLAGQKVFQIQEQECDSGGGASKWQCWQQPEIVSAEGLLMRYKNMQESNRASWRPSDWHIRIIGTPPMWVLDDLDMEKIRQLVSDGLSPFAVVGTSPGNYQVWIKLQSDKEYLGLDEWHLIHRHLRDKYGADRGAGGTGHAFRLPLPGGYSHKKTPHQLQIAVSDKAPAMSVAQLIAQIPPREKERNMAEPHRLFRYPENWDGADKVQIPDWFMQKWERRKNEIMQSEKCPKRKDGSADMSSVEYRTAAQCLYGYRNASADRQDEIALWLAQIISADAAERNKPKPDDYARRTVSNVAAQLGLPIVSSAEQEREHQEDEIRR